MKSIFIGLAKRYILKSINELLSKNKDNVKKICDTIQQWTNRLNVVCAELTCISMRCSDGELDSDEVKKSLEEVEKIVKEWK